MHLVEFLQDKGTNHLSATRLGFLLLLIGGFGVCAYASVHEGALQPEPGSVVAILGLLATGKVVQRYGGR